MPVPSDPSGAPDPGAPVPERPAPAGRELRIGHSPDPDDAFMWYPLANFRTPDGVSHTPRIDTGPYRFVHVLEDIQSLNERSERGELEITAFSAHQYPFVADRYAMTSCGSSMGDRYGPMIVARPGRFDGVRALHGARLAIPGRRTTAWLATQLLLAEQGVSAASLDVRVMRFDEILGAVTSGRVDAGLIIHEGQITYEKQRLALVEDLGRWWTETRGVPLPLGANALRRDLVESGEAPAICRILLDSIRYAMAHRQEAVRFALNYARDMDDALADRFVGMYVNDWTLDYGVRGREAVRRLIGEGVDAGLVPDCGEIDFVDPAPA